MGDQPQDSARPPGEEPARLAALHQYEILDSEPEGAFDALTRLAAHICGTPMALFALVDSERQWFKSKLGIGVAETSREGGFCAHAIEGRDLFVVPDARTDARFAAHPMVVDAPHIRFYAGVPLITPHAHALGTLCVLDSTPRELSAEQIKALEALGQEAMTQLELRRQNRELAPARERLELILETAGEGIYELDPQGRVRFVNRAAVHMLGWESDELLGRYMHELVHHTRPDGSAYPDDECPIVAALEDGQTHEAQDELLWRKDGAALRVHYTSTPMFHAGELMGTVVIFHDISARKRAEEALRRSEETQRFLAETSAVLSSSLDYELTLKRLAELAVPRLADLCFFDIVTRDGDVKRVGWTHVDRGEKDGLDEIADFAPPPGADSHPVSRVLATGRAELVPEVTDDWRRAVALNERHLRFMRELEPKSAMTVPLNAQDRTLGALTLCYLEGRRYTPAQLDLANELARRAAIAIDNAQLYRMARKELVERQQAEALLSHLANHDSLTELPNRGLLEERLSRALSEAAHDKRSVAVLLLDLDRFKRVNDTLGHEVGDSLLRAVAKRVKACIRKSDTVARWGGDEFVVMLAALATTADARRIAQKILNALSEPFKLDEHELVVTGSIGICVYPKESRRREGLLKRADAAMYRAKQQGGNQYQHYAPAAGSKLSGGLALENKLRSALDRDEFLLHYQPQVDPDTGRIVAAEALLRWKARGRSRLIPPAKFVPVAEAHGLIVPIGEWVLRAACAQNQAWRKQGLAPIPVAVNLSARQFHQSDMVRTIERVLRQTGLEPDGLELELTETLLQTVDAEKALRPLKRMGVKVAIDDFGTGYSSLSYLKRFAINSLKIDRSFVKGIPDNADDCAIVNAIIAMARGLRLKLTAEGVETTGQLEFLREGCDAIQGYLFSKPLPVEELAELLRAPPSWPLKRQALKLA